MKNKKRKKLLIILLILPFILTGCDFKMNHENNKNDDNIVEKKDKEDNTLIDNDVDYIGGEKAREIALKSASLEWDDIHDYEIELKSKNDIPLYEIEFEANEHEYEYVINAKTGDIIEYTMQKERNNNEKDDDKDSSKKEEKMHELDDVDGITETEAVNIALDKSGVKKEDLDFLKTYVVKYEGNFAYHIKFRLNDKEYEYMIDIATGNIVSYETD